MIVKGVPVLLVNISGTVNMTLVYMDNIHRYYHIQEQVPSLSRRQLFCIDFRES